jgi:hypothetical protein
MTIDISERQVDASVVPPSITKQDTLKRTIEIENNVLVKLI